MTDTEAKLKQAIPLDTGIDVIEHQQLSAKAVAGAKKIAPKLGNYFACRMNQCAAKHISNIFGEFDSGSERTLAAWIRHASRTKKRSSNVDQLSGARVSNMWTIFQKVWDSSPKGEIIPHKAFRGFLKFQS